MDVDNSDFVQFVEVANACAVDYMLIGGLALILNGAIRFTQDVDVWLQPTNENRDRTSRHCWRLVTKKQT